MIIKNYGSRQGLFAKYEGLFAKYEGLFAKFGVLFAKFKIYSRKIKFYSRKPDFYSRTHFLFAKQYVYSRNFLLILKILGLFAKIPINSQSPSVFNLLLLQNSTVILIKSPSTLPIQQSSPIIPIHPPNPAVFHNNSHPLSQSNSLPQ